MPNPLTYLLIAIVVVIMGFVVLVRYLEKTGVFFPSRSITFNPSSMDLPWEDVYFKTRDNITLNGWLIKNPKAKSTVLFAHGNAGNISGRLFKINFFYELGLNVFVFDYRGYGKSQGVPSEQGIYVDAQAAYDYLQSRGDIDMQCIILYGASLGGIVVTDLATQRNAALLVVESSITSAADMARIHYPYVPRFLMSLKFNSLGKVKVLNIPKVFIHSPEDDVVPYWMGRKLFEEAKEPKEFLQTQGGHNEGSMAQEPLVVQSFVQILKQKDLL